MIYMIACDAMSAMKIGYSADSPDSRLKSLQTGNPHPLRLVAVREGDLMLEATIHHELAKFRMGGFSPWTTGGTGGDAGRSLLVRQRPRSRLGLRGVLLCTRCGHALERVRRAAG
jgi:hypothetical protein